MTVQWAPFTLSWDDHLPIDISFVFERERPAGARGFLKTDGARFVFEDGSEARFWGTCFNSGQNFPTHDESEMVARRLAKFGVNIMRTHQMDAEWATPNLFQFNRANPKNDTRTFDPESMDRLDYLIYCLKQEGIYIYLDMLTYRQFRPGDEVDAVEALGQAAKPYTYFDPRLIELQQEFARDLWTHINPYTKLAYKDDPAIALTEIKNESDLFTHKPVLEPYRSRLETLYRAWADEQGKTVSAEPVDFANPDTQQARFLVQVMQDFNANMITYLRSIGVKIPIAGTNWSRTLGVTASQLTTDFTDSHVYWNFPRWETGETDTAPMVAARDTALGTLSFMRLLDRPFFVSEWDHAWPAEWRAESTLWYAAVGALQGWSGFTIHTYRYASWGPVYSLGGGASTINGITYRNHFDTFNDPAKFGLFYHAALLFRRGDVQTSAQPLAIEIPEDDTAWPLLRTEDVPALRWVEKQRIGMLLPGQPAPPGDVRTIERQTLDGVQDGDLLSDTRQLWRSPSQRIGWVDTPRTKVVYGFLGQAGPIQLDGLTVDVETDFATIALSSLTDDPLDSTASILLTAVGRADNSGARYDETRRQQLDFGGPPIVIEPIEAHLSLRTSRPHLKIWVIDEKGEAVTPLERDYRDGALHFKIGAQPRWNHSTIYYLLTL